MKNSYLIINNDRNLLIFFISAVLVLLTAGVIWKYYFNIYEIECVTNKNILWSDNQSKVIINCLPINSLGLKIPFRNSHVVFSIIEGNELVDIIQKDEMKGMLLLKSKFEEGKVLIKITSRYSLLPNLVEINIIKNLS
jgi:hypothetical protein